MTGDEAAELAAGVSAGAEHADRDLIHAIMHNHAWNRAVNGCFRPAEPAMVDWASLGEER